MAGDSTPANPADAGGTRPVPDPTVLTTDQIRREISTIKELFDEKFTSVDDKLALGERQRVEQKSDTEKAIQAALTAQKEAVAAQASSFSESVAKSEAATTKQLDQMQATFKVEIQAVTKGLEDLRLTVESIRSLAQGGRESKAAVYALVGVIATVIIVGLSLVAFFQP